MSKMPAVPEWLDAKTFARPIGVDRENNVLRGYTVAQAGPFKSDGRGEFDREALERIVSLGNAKNGGLKSRFTHPSLSSDGLGKFLGRAKNLAMGTALDARTGRTVEAVRADLHFDKTALDTPPDGGKPLGVYVMDLAESDPDAISSSIVVRVDQKYRLTEKGTRATGPDGEELPPLWIPKELHASDIVDVGDAVDGLLSAGINPAELPDGVVRLATDGLNKLFAGCDRETVAARAQAWLTRYLDGRYGAADEQFKLTRTGLSVEDAVMGGLDVMRRKLDIKIREGS